MPADYDFTQEFRDLAAAHGIVSPAVDVAWDRHKAHHQTKGSMFTNAGWTGRAWLQWLTNEIGYRSSADIKAEAEAPPPVPRKVTPAAWEAHPGIVEFRKKLAGESGE